MTDEIAAYTQLDSPHIEDNPYNDIPMPEGCIAVLIPHAEVLCAITSEPELNPWKTAEEGRYVYDQKPPECRMSIINRGGIAVKQGDAANSMYTDADVLVMIRPRR